MDVTDTDIASFTEKLVRDIANDINDTYDALSRGQGWLYYMSILCQSYVC